MAGACDQIRSQDPAAGSVCELLVQETRMTPEHLDRGEFAIDFEASPGPRVYWTQPDGYQGPSDVYNVFFEKIDSSIPLVPSIFLEAARANQIELPFLIDDFDESTVFDAQFRSAVRAEIETLHERMIGQGITPEDEFYTKFMAENLYYFVAENYPMKYSPHHKGAYSCLEALQKGEANCLEFAFILYSVYRMAGLPVEFVEVIQEDPHIVLSLHAGTVPGKTFFVDPADWRIVYDAPEDIDWINIPLSVALAYHHFNKATTVTDEAYLKSENFEELEAEYLKAITYAPNHWRFQYGLATLYARHDRLQQAKAAYQRAIELKPDEEMLYQHLSIVNDALGE